MFFQKKEQKLFPKFTYKYAKFWMSLNFDTSSLKLKFLYNRLALIMCYLLDIDLALFSLLLLWEVRVNKSWHTFLAKKSWLLGVYKSFINIWTIMILKICQSRAIIDRFCQDEEFGLTFYVETILDLAVKKDILFKFFDNNVYFIVRLIE